MSDNLADEFGILREQKNNRIYGNAANQVLRSSSDDNANISLFLIFHSIYIHFLIIRLIFRVDTKARNEGVSW